MNSARDREFLKPVIPCQEPDFDSQSDSLKIGLTLAAADYQTLLEALAEAQTLEQERLTRIHHLEQALDQALACLEELRSQIQDQQLLEVQLAHTENYASVQQQAIVRLKIQLSEQNQALETQLLETQQRDQAIQELLATIENMTQTQQREVERLRSRLAQDQLDVQTHRSLLGKHLQGLQTALESRQQRVSELETETLAARSLSTQLQHQLEGAQQQIKQLSARLSQHRLQLIQLETQLEQAQSGCAVGSVSIEPAQWQQQELEQERQQQQVRSGQLEHQVAEMQEQILRQAQQATEYETAIQYWRDRYTTSQQQFSQIKDLAEKLQQSGQALPALGVELLSALQTLLLAESESSPAPLPLSRLATVELPEFLIRRRAQRIRLSELNSAPEKSD